MTLRIWLLFFFIIKLASSGHHHHHHYYYCLPQVTNIMITDIPIITNVNHPITLDTRLLVLSFSIFLSFAIFITAKRIGTATMPLITAVYTNALIGSTLVKFIHNPINVEAAITK